HQQEDAPEQVMNVQTAGGDDIAKWPVREELEVDDRGDDTQNAKREEKGRQCAERNPPTGIEPPVVMPKAEPHDYVWIFFSNAAALSLSSRFSGAHSGSNGALRAQRKRIRASSTLPLFA